jgi:hypothetical protein
MTDGIEVLHVVRQWIEKAEEDLITARHSLTLLENCPSAPSASTPSRLPKNTSKPCLLIVLNPSPKHTIFLRFSDACRTSRRYLSIPSISVFSTVTP